MLIDKRGKNDMVAQAINGDMYCSLDGKLPKDYDPLFAKHIKFVSPDGLQLGEYVILLIKPDQTYYRWFLKRTHAKETHSDGRRAFKFHFANFPQDKTLVKMRCIATGIRSAQRKSVQYRFLSIQCRGDEKLDTMKARYIKVRDHSFIDISGHGDWLRWMVATHAMAREDWDLEKAYKYDGRR
jgi:hypothetical protein